MSKEPEEWHEPISDPNVRQWHYQEKADAYTHIVRTHDGKIVVSLPQDTSGKAEADARLIAAAPDLLEAAKCEDDLNAFVAGNNATQTEIVDRWLDRINELSPLEHGTHEAHASWTRHAFCGIPEILRRAAIAKAEPNVPIGTGEPT